MGDDDKRISEEALRQVVDLIPFPITITRVSDGTLLFVNEAVAQYLKRPAGELIGNPAPNYYANQREEILTLLEERGELRDYEVRSCLPDGTERVSLVNLQRIDFGGEPSLLAAAADITELRKTERELEQSRAQLRHSQKMEALGRLAGGVAHDFNNLLTAIMGSSTVIERNIDSQERVLEEVAEIRAAAERAAKLTQQLLAFGRKQPMKPEIIDLRQTVSEARGMLARLVGEHVDLRIELSEEPSTALVDVTQLEQVLMNLVINAADALEREGRITVRVEKRDLHEDVETEQGTVGAGEWATLVVEDSGPGMERETLSRIFEPFFTTKAAGVGSGLGLSTVHGIVEQSGGVVEVWSEPGCGTTFRVHLPHAKGFGRSVTGEIVMPDAPRGGDERILVVEDNEMLLRLCSRILTAAGYEVLKAADGRAALELAKRQDRPADLLLTDVMMPGLKGPEVADAIRELWPEVAVIYMTGYAADILGERADRETMRLLNKPFHPDVLEAAVREALDERQKATRALDQPSGP